MLALWGKVGYNVGGCGIKWCEVGGELLGFPGNSLVNSKVELMFLGQYAHNLDDKGRLTIPARFRDLLEGGAYVTQGFEHNLMVLTPLAFENLSNQVNEMSITDPTSRQLKRLLFAAADLVDMDRSGRIRIPQFLRDVAGLDAETIIVGAGNYFEIWSPDKWQEQAELLKDTDANAEKFAVLNIATPL